MQQSTFIWFPILNKMNIYNNLYAFLATANKVRTNLENLNDFYVSDTPLFNTATPYRNKFLNYTLNLFAKIVLSPITVDKCIWFTVPEYSNNPHQVNDEVYIITVKYNTSMIDDKPRIFSIYADYNKRTTVIIVNANVFSKTVSEEYSARILADIYFGLFEFFTNTTPYCGILIPELSSSDNSNIIVAYISILDLINSTINYWYGKPRNMYNNILINVVNYKSYGYNKDGYLEETQERLEDIFCDESNEKITVDKDRINTYLTRFGKSINKEYKVIFDDNEL